MESYRYRNPESLATNAYNPTLILPYQGTERVSERFLYTNCIERLLHRRSSLQMLAAFSHHARRCRLHQRQGW